MITEEERKLVDAVDWFAREMKGKLLAKLHEGVVGWDAEPWLRNHALSCLRRHVNLMRDGDYSQVVDVANLAMFIAYAEREGQLG